MWRDAGAIVKAMGLVQIATHAIVLTSVGCSLVDLHTMRRANRLLHEDSATITRNTSATPGDERLCGRRREHAAKLRAREIRSPQPQERSEK